MRRDILFLILVIFLGAYLRLNNLANNPPGFYTDEASIGYNAYKILTTGHDEHGKFMPVFFEAFGEYKNPFAIYPVVPFLAVFGVSEVSVRLAQVVLGLLDIVLLFYLGKVLWNGTVGLLSAYVMATSPWHIHLSRFIIESHNAFLFFIISGSLFLVLAKRSKWATKYLVMTATLFALSFYTYFATRVFTPLFLLGLLFFRRKQIIELLKGDFKKVFLAAIIFFVILSPFIVHMVSGKGLVRFNQVSNKSGGLARNFGLYLKHFEPKFVFVYGDSDYPGQQIIRHSVSGMGLFYKWQLPFFVAGFLFLIFARKKENEAKVLVFLMLILYPLGTIVSSAVTPFATRSVEGIIPYSLLIAFGIYRVFGVLKSRLFKFAFIFAVVFLNVFYLDRFLDLYKAYVNRAYGYSGFQYGAGEIVKYFMEDGVRYSTKILDGGFDGNQAYLDFYSLGKCSGCYAFDPAPDNREMKKLIGVSVDNLTSFYDRYNGEVVHKIYYPDGREAHYIFEATSKKVSSI